MVITDEAKKYISDALQEYGANGIRLFQDGMGCGGPKLGLSTEDPMEGDLVEEINGITVAIEESVLAEAKKITLDFQEEGLVIIGMDNCC
ncbi:hypothetical protein [Caldalkalibacillus mannanilyticus]|uniref:hypothetical protein n=1 Tax=Caldalkalibacillus mannanilyticus TaxID=1418 RepID=UPI00046AFD98|nr:hypothetical protein [Caldalkalibacillus mannanilyticus]